jgi:NAD(P)-dependent dehydrogenase (short-subunit alcohol dehydrogenase family)
VARRRILITGATDGIGLALARRLADQHDLLLTGRRPMVEGLPSGVLYVRADQADPVAAATIVDAALSASGWHALDLAILNAGTGFAAKDGFDDPATIRLTLDVNLSSAVALSSMLFARLAAASGGLVLIGSTARRGSAAFPAYAASKAALHGFARALRAEWRGRVAVQMLHPGPTATAMHAKAGFDPGRMRAVFAGDMEMAAMIEDAIASGAAGADLSFLRRVFAVALRRHRPERRL